MAIKSKRSGGQSSIPFSQIGITNHQRTFQVQLDSTGSALSLEQLIVLLLDFFLQQSKNELGKGFTMEELIEQVTYGSFKAITRACEQLVDWDSLWKTKGIFCAGY